MKIRAAFTTFITLLALTVFPVVAYAQTDTPAAPSDIPITNLPNDLKDQEPTDTNTDVTTTTDNRPITQKEEFIAGVGVGIAFGIIAGGVIIWFVKK